MKESELVKAFIRSGEIEGSWGREVAVHPEILDKALKRQNFEEYTAQLGKRSNALRIDALCITKRCVYIVEAKKALVPSALGQLLCYKALYELNHPDICKGMDIILVALVLETNDILEAIFQEHNIIIKVWKE